MVVTKGMYTYTLKVTRHLGHFFYLTTASRLVWEHDCSRLHAFFIRMASTLTPSKKGQNLTFSPQDLLTQQLFLKIDGMVVDIQLGG